MKVRLNGWQRLWVVVSILYFFPVAGILVMSWPTPETTWHRDEFILQMPADLRGHVDEAYGGKSKWREALGIRSDDATTKAGKAKTVVPLPPNFILESAPVSFPNGAVLQVHVAKEGDKEPDARVGVAYWTVVQSATRAARWTMVWQLALVWFIPCLMLYLLGWATAWVRHGFTHGRDRTTGERR